MFDTHIHTNNSNDCNQTIEEVCTAAIKNGLSGISITDHVDMWFTKELNTIDCIRNCIREVNNARTVFGDKLKIFQGIEMAEYMYAPAEADEILGLCDYDIVLGSVHSVKYMNWDDSYSKISFDTESTSEEKISGFMYAYFDKVKEMVEKTDIDVMTHLTCPLRYINEKFGRNFDISGFYKGHLYLFCAR